MDRAWERKDGILVYSRLLDTGKMLVEHVVITSRDTRAISWLTKQEIKNDLFGSEVEAIEIFPEERERVDTEGLYHLWIPQGGTKLPFGIDRRKLKTVDRGYMRDTIGFLFDLADIFGISLGGDANNGS